MCKGVDSTIDKILNLLCTVCMVVVKIDINYLFNFIEIGTEKIKMLHHRGIVLKVYLTWKGSTEKQVGKHQDVNTMLHLVI